tara:strand:- start:172 stop:594 length:423 start_codon:yes stop_codon:yes gene_type:complete
MIKYNLKCHNNHEFQSWFSNSDEYEKLNRNKLLECIYCTSKKISKSIMAPMISNSKKNDEQIEITNKDLKHEKNQLLELRKYIENNFDYVGKDFSKKVREIYYDDKNNKAIYGTATSEEREELANEGIDLLSIPWINKDN